MTERSGPGEHGLKVPNWFLREAIREHRLTHLAALTYVALCDRARSDRTVLTSQNVIARDLVAHRSSIQTALMRLTEAGLIEPLTAPRIKVVTPYYIVPIKPRAIPRTLPPPTRRARFDDDAKGWLALPDDGG